MVFRLVGVLRRALLEVTAAECWSQPLQVGWLRAVTPLSLAWLRALGSPRGSVGHQSKAPSFGGDVALGLQLGSSCAFEPCWGTAAGPFFSGHSDEHLGVGLGSGGMLEAPCLCLAAARGSQALAAHLASQSPRLRVQDGAFGWEVSPALRSPSPTVVTSPLWSVSVGTTTWERTPGQREMRDGEGGKQGMMEGSRASKGAECGEKARSEPC